MSIPVIVLFHSKGDVGMTYLIYHLAWMYADLGMRVVAADLDPQANLTAAFLDEDRLEELWSDDGARDTIYGGVEPLVSGIGDIKTPPTEALEDNLSLVVGDLALSRFEDELSESWPKCMDGDERAFRVVSAFWRILQETGETHEAAAILVDIGPNLGAINRAALIASDHVIVPVSPDLFSLQGLRNLGPTLRRWRDEWKARLAVNPVEDLSLPSGEISPGGYIVLQHTVRLDRPRQGLRPLDRTNSVLLPRSGAERAR